MYTLKEKQATLFTRRKIKVIMYKRNASCRLCVERDETVNHIISECRKVAKEQLKTWRNWLGKVFLRKWCMK